MPLSRWRSAWSGAAPMSCAASSTWSSGRLSELIWAVERGFVWPLEERTGDWDPPLRALGVGALALLAAGAGVLGLLWASGSGGGGTSPAPEASAPVTAPIVRQVAPPPATAAAPVLQGAKPDFADAPSSGASKSSSASAESAATTNELTTEGGSTAEVAKSTAPSSAEAAGAATVKPAGPPAAKVARQFAGAFVLYEIGRKTSQVRSHLQRKPPPRSWPVSSCGGRRGSRQASRCRRRKC